MWTFSFYLHAYNTEWCHVYLTLHIECCPWELITCIRCWVRKTYRAFLCWQTDSSPCTSSAIPTVHHLHQVLREKDGEICSLFIERKKINQTISDKWVLKIVLHMWSPVIQSRYMTAFQSVYMCIVAKRCQHVTFSDIMQKLLIKNSTSDNRNTKHIMTSKKGWWQIKLFMTDIFHTSWWVIQVVTW